MTKALFPQRPSIRLIGACLALGLLAIGAQLYATSWGGGVSPDSTKYIAGARGLLAGEGLSYPSGSGEPIPITLWPPLFPLLLAIPGMAGVDPAVAGRLLNALLMGGNVLLAGYMVWRYTQGSPLAAGLSALVVLISPDILGVHVWIWTEPLFIFLCLAGLYFGSLAVSSARPGHLRATAGLAAMAILTRYAGVALILTCAAAFLGLARSGRLRQRMWVAGSFLIGSSLPLGFWLLRNQLVAGSPTQRAIAFHRLYGVHFAPALDTISRWLLPALQPGALRTAALGAAWIMVLWIVVRFAANELKAAAEEDPQSSLRFLPHLLSIFLLIYAAILVFSKVYVDPNFPFNDRILSPAFAASSVLIACLGHRALRREPPAPGAVLPIGARLPLLLAGSLVLFAHLATTAAHSVQWLERTHQRGLGYQSASWQQSSLVQFVGSLPAEAAVFSNAEDGVHFSTDHPAWRLPSRGESSDDSSSDRDPAWISEIREKLGGRPGYVVYFDAITWRSVVSIPELEPYFALQSVLQTPEGEAVRIEPLS